MFERVKDTIFRNDYIRYLEHLNIDSTEIINSIKTKLEDKGLFDILTNRSYNMLSPNIVLENIIFKEVNKYLLMNDNDLNLFKRDIEIDIKTLIATQSSILERPNIKKPLDVKQGYNQIIKIEDNFIQIARFENEMVKNDNGWGRKGQTIVFEGLTIFEDESSFFEGLPSSLIWENALYFSSYPFIIWFGKKFNSIESNNVLWINSLLLQDLDLKLDSFNNGLQALNKKDEVVLKFRQWRSDLVGQDSNIAKLEGSDLILREDYYEKLKMIIPNMRFYSYRMDLQ